MIWSAKFYEVRDILNGKKLQTGEAIYRNVWTSKKMRERECDFWKDDL